MSHTRRPVARPRSSPEWFVQGVRTYDCWREGETACATCAATVDLTSQHVGVELLRRRATRGKRLYDRERVVCCSESCANVWLSE